MWGSSAVEAADHHTSITSETISTPTGDGKRLRKRVQIRILDYIKEPGSDQTRCCNHQCIEMLCSLFGCWEHLSYLCGWVVKAQLLTVQLTPWQLMLVCNTNVSSPPYNLFLNETVHLSTSKTATQAVRLFQRSNERPCSGWINTPTS